MVKKKNNVNLDWKGFGGLLTVPARPPSLTCRAFSVFLVSLIIFICHQLRSQNLTNSIVSENEFMIIWLKVCFCLLVSPNTICMPLRLANNIFRRLIKPLIMALQPQMDAPQFTGMFLPSFYCKNLLEAYRYFCVTGVGGVW